LFTDDESEEHIDEGACWPMAMPTIIQSQAQAARRIQPARKAKDAAAARQKAMAQKIQIPVAQKVCKKKRVVARKKKAPPAPKTKPIARKKQPAAPKKAPPAPKKAPPAPKRAPKKAPVKKAGANRGRRVHWNNLDLLIQVQRDNVCFFYVIGIVRTHIPTRSISSTHSNTTHTCLHVLSLEFFWVTCVVCFGSRKRNVPMHLIGTADQKTLEVPFLQGQFAWSEQRHLTSTARGSACG